MLETLGRKLVGRPSPVPLTHTLPGAYQNYIYLFLAVSMIALTLWSGRNSYHKDE